MTVAFWMTAILLLAAALLFVLPPLMRPRTEILAGPSPLAVYREQRAHADAEFAQGALTAEQHAQQLAELQGRVIDEVGETATPSGERRTPFASVLALALLLPGGALGIYAVVGQPAALRPAAVQAAATGNGHGQLTQEQMEEMVERLAGKLQAAPNDPEGWHMLARSYIAVGRLPEAAQAYERASQMSPRDAQLLADYADTLAMVNGRNLDGRPTELVKAALAVDPKHPKALSLAGTASFNRGDYPGAIAYWKRLHALLPADSAQASGIAASIAEAESKAGGAGSAGIEGTVVLSDALRSQLQPGTTLFVFARPAQGSRMPIAIARAPVGNWPFAFRLDDSSAMNAQQRLSTQGEVVLGARISANGMATPQSGDLVGTLGPVKVGAKGVKIVIDEVVR
jgi:cytochrome c-type biogenesis protein CcmH